MDDCCVIERYERGFSFLLTFLVACCACYFIQNQRRFLALSSATLTCTLHRLPVCATKETLFLKDSEKNLKNEWRSEEKGAAVQSYCASKPVGGSTQGEKEEREDGELNEAAVEY